MQKRKLASAKVGEKVDLTLRQLGYSQESIKGFFRDNRPVSQMLNELHCGEKSISEIPIISAVVEGDHIYSVDNRRLWTFKHCGISLDTPVTVRAGARDEAFRKKFTTPTQGQSIRKRSLTGFV